uniref:Uncharacterized protein n=1 Tax=Macrostomum lignano TaxID=282301 RepID=A0A1I8H2N7_9PLAT
MPHLQLVPQVNGSESFWSCP